MTARPAAPAATSDLRATFAEDVRHYLRQHPRQLPSRYLYDDLGSALFEAICRLPWYSLTRAETRLLQAHARGILSADGPSVVVELGPGSGDKIATLLGAAGPVRGPLDVHLVDVSRSALEQARRAVESVAGVRVETHERTYETGLRQLADARAGRGRLLVLFLGSNIGNFDPPGRETFLRHLRSTLRPGDRLLIGADLVKPERGLLLAYDDPLGVTAAFNRNPLVRINRELQGNIRLNAFAHRAVWNPEASRVEMHLVSAVRQRVEIAAADLRLEMAAGESIWTESSYKYEPDGIADFLRHCGFRVAAQWIDAADRFALTHAEAI
jgi:dimethylhistidine N-methyltransferase